MAMKIDLAEAFTDKVMYLDSSFIQFPWKFYTSN